MTSDATTTPSITLAVAFGHVVRPVHEVLADLLKRQPEIVWREPVPTRQRLDGFVGLWHGDWDQFCQNHPKAALDEARLFWNGQQQPGVVHLVAGVYGQPGCRDTHWAAFWEAGEDAGLPGWLDRDVLGEPEAVETCTIDTCVEEPVLTMAERDRNRYGLGAMCHPPELRKLKVRKFFRGTEVPFWRLSVD